MHYYAIFLSPCTQHVQEKLNLTGGRKAGEAQQAQAAAAPGQVAAAQPAAELFEEEDDD